MLTLEIAGFDHEKMKHPALDADAGLHQEFPAEKRLRIDQGATAVDSESFASRRIINTYYG
jgi:hypothetical protein